MPCDPSGGVFGIPRSPDRMSGTIRAWMPHTGAIAPKISTGEMNCLRIAGSFKKVASLVFLLIVVVVFGLAAIGAQPDMRDVWQFRFGVDFDPSGINGLCKALDVFSCIAMNADDV